MTKFPKNKCEVCGNLFKRVFLIKGTIVCHRCAYKYGFRKKLGAGYKFGQPLKYQRAVTLTLTEGQAKFLEDDSSNLGLTVAQYMRELLLNRMNWVENEETGEDSGSGAHSENSAPVDTLPDNEKREGLQRVGEQVGKRVQESYWEGL